MKNDPPPGSLLIGYKETENCSENSNYLKNTVESSLSEAKNTLSMPLLRAQGMHLVKK